MGVKRGSTSNQLGFEPKDKKFIELRSKILSRDRYTCVSCQLPLEESEAHVHHTDDDHENSTIYNMVTRCPLCHGVNHLDLLAPNVGYIVYFPTLTQALLNHLSLSIAIAKHYGEEHADLACELENEILQRFTEPVIRIFGSCEPQILGQVMHELSDEEYNRRGGSLSEIRLFYNPDRLLKTAQALKKRHYETAPIEAWQSIYQSILKKAEQ